MVTAVKQYFDQRSAKYSHLNNAPLWRWQRARETKAVTALMGPVIGESILDLGCGSGHYSRHFLDLGARHVTAIDSSASMIAQLPELNVSGIVANAEDVQLDKSFSKIVCAGLLEFVSSPDSVLSCAREFIDETGHMICLVPPNNWAGRLYRRYHRRHNIEINLFARPHFNALCSKNGWTIESHISVFPYSDVYHLRPKQIA